jgi:hypothetical protein
LLHIFSYLQIEDILNVTLKIVCSDWHEALEDENFYEHLLKQRLQSKIKKTKSWRFLFIQIYKLKKQNKLNLHDIQPIMPNSVVKVGIISENSNKGLSKGYCLLVLEKKYKLSPEIFTRIFLCGKVQFQFEF